MKTVIAYAHESEVWDNFAPYLLSLIDNKRLRKICDVGGGANPSLGQEDIEKRSLDYSVLDISQAELEKAPAAYNKILGDVAAPEFSSNQKFDLIFSKMLAEHVSDARQFHTNVFNLLSENGYAVHFFPTLYTLPFLANYLMPESLSSVLLNIFAPRDKYQKAKFPAYYRWCRGPTRRQLRRFTDLGYELVEYKGFYGHGYYDTMPIVANLSNRIARYLIKQPSPLLTSYALIVLRRAKPIDIGLSQA